MHAVVFFDHTDTGAAVPGWKRCHFAPLEFPCDQSLLLRRLWSYGQRGGIVQTRRHVHGLFASSAEDRAIGSVSHGCRVFHYALHQPPTLR
jgi:hypothetical protein